MKRLVLFVVLTIYVLSACSVEVPGMESCEELLGEAVNSEVTLSPEIMEIILSLAGDQQCVPEVQTVTEYVEVPGTTEEIHHCYTLSMCFHGEWNNETERCDFFPTGFCTDQDFDNIACYNNDPCLKGKMLDDRSCRYYNQCWEEEDMLCTPERIAECDDHNPCTIEECIPYTGDCLYNVVPNCTEEVPDVYLQDRNCRFTLKADNSHIKVYSNEMADYGGATVNPQANEVPIMFHHGIIQSPEHGVVGLGDFSAISDVLRAFTTCFMQNETVSVLVFGNEHCSPENQNYPTGIEGINVTYLENPFKDENIGPAYSAIEYTEAKNKITAKFDIVVACIGPEMFTMASELHQLTNFAKADNLDLFMVVTEGVETFPEDEYHLKTLYRLNRHVSKFGLYFDYDNHEAEDQEAGYDVVHAFIEY